MSYKVLHLVDHLNEYCGMSFSTMQMIQAVRHDGFEGQVWTGLGTGLDKARCHDIPVHVFEDFTKKKTVSNLWAIVEDINALVKKNNIDLLHAHHRLLGFIGWFIARRNGIPIVHSDHNILYGNKFFSYWGDLVIADSKVNKQHLEKYFGVPEKKIVTCYAFTDLDSLLDHEIEMSDQIVNIGQIGRLEEQKGQKYLIDAFKNYLDTNEQAHLYLKGEGALRQELAEQVETKGVAGRVHFESSGDDIRSFFEKIDCFIISSLFEGTCMVAVEAAAYGVPIISTRVGGIPDYLEDGNSAIFVAPGSADQLLGGLQKMSTLSSNERKKMAEKARASIQPLFNADRQAAVIANAYRNVLN